jgi:endo-1,4-beta-D-glucanase Y
MSWQFLAACKPPEAMDNDAATDGDLDAAFAFLLAEKQWGSPSYGQQGRILIDAVLNREMNPQTKLPLLGDWASPTDDQGQYYSTRLSDHMPDHFRAFATASGNTTWNASVTSVYDLMNTIQTKFSPMTGLVPDFVKKTDADPSPVAVTEADALLMEQLTTDYDYNACRVPWRLGTDLVVKGDPAAKTVLGKLNAFIKAKTGGDPAMILDGYSLAGDVHSGAGPNGCFTSGFGVAAMSDPGSQVWLDAIWNQLVKNTPDDYFGDTVSLLAMIVMSGNWWTP